MKATSRRALTAPQRQGLWRTEVVQVCTSGAGGRVVAVLATGDAADVLPRVSGDAHELDLLGASVQGGRDLASDVLPGSFGLGFETPQPGQGCPDLPLFRGVVHGTKRRPLVEAYEGFRFCANDRWPHVVGISMPTSVGYFLLIHQRKRWYAREETTVPIAPRARRSDVQVAA